MSEEYPRRVLFAVTGMSPQIVTETVWALMQEKDFIPTEIRLVTTLHGRNKAIRMLLQPTTGHFLQFCRDYGLTGKIRFDESCIAVIRSRAGEALADIRTPEDNVAAADMIVQEVQQLCADPASQVHASIAGGRKSMGFFAGYAMSLYGRAQDSLSHVLVSEAFENNPDFFYPPPEDREIFARDGTPLNARDARVMLADIPFVRMRGGLPEALLAGSHSFGEAIREAQAGMLPLPTLAFSPSSCEVRCSGIRIKLSPLLYVIYYWLAQRLKDKLPPVRPGGQEVRELLALHERLFPNRSGDWERAQKALRHDEDALPFFQEKRSRIHKALKETLGEKRASPFFIEASGKRPFTRYALTLPPEAVSFSEQLP